MKSWPQGLRTMLRVMLGSPCAMWLGWGRELFFFCNDACLPVLGQKRCWTMGAAAPGIWGDRWTEIGPAADAVLTARVAAASVPVREDAENGDDGGEIARTFCVSAMPDDAGAVAGLLCIVQEATPGNPGAPERDASGLFLPPARFASGPTGLRPRVRLSEFATPADGVTGRREAEAALRDSEERLRSRLVGGMASDVTDQKDTELARERLAAIVESSDDAIVGKDLQGVITSWNRGAERVFGYQAAEIIGSSVLRLIPPELQSEEPAILRQIRAGQRIEHHETRRRRKDGREIDVSLSISPIKNAAGEVVGVSKIARDVTERKRTEIELRRREQLYRAIGESIEYGIWVCDATGRNIYASESFLRLVGLTQQQCSDFGWGDILHPDEAEATIAAWKACVQSGAVWECQHRMRGVDGAWHPILARGVPIRDESGAIIRWAGINLDTSRLTRNEEALRQQTRNLEVLNRVGRVLAAERELGPLMQAVTEAGREVSGAAVGAFFYNVENESDASSLRHSLSGAASLEAFAAFGAPPNAPLFEPTFRGKGVVRLGDLLKDPRYGALTPHDGMPRSPLSLRSYLAVPVISASGAVHGGLVFGHPEPDMFAEGVENLVLAIAAQAAIAMDNAKLYQAMQRELREHERAEFALRESEERFRTLADNVAQFAWITDQTGWIIWYNRRWFDYTGTTLSDMEGWGWRRVHHPDHVERVVEKFTRCIASGTVWEDTFPLRGLDGTYRWFLSRAVPIHDDRGQVVRWFGTNTDITELREVEQALKRARDEAVAASRAKDEFLAALSHELRTPLNPVLLLASDAAENPALPMAVRTDFETIRKNVSLEARLIDDLLDLTRISRGKLSLELKPHDVHTILRDALATVRSDAAEKHVALTERFNADGGLVRADVVRLQQVFWNVLKNAVKFTPPGGHVEVATRMLSEPRRVEIAVTDTGIGMTAAEIARVFDTFSQGDHATGSEAHRFGGLGLGLAISRMVVELHTGTIAASSRGPGQGASFAITLPVLEGEPDALAQLADVPVPAAQPLAVGGRILLVEDHAPTRQTLERLLARRRFFVVSAGSLAEARALMSAGTFDLLISDVGLPDGSGCDLMRECARDGGLKGIALTGYGMEADVARSREAGFAAHLTKPINVHALDRTIGAVMRPNANKEHLP